MCLVVELPEDLVHVLDVSGMRATNEGGSATEELHHGVDGPVDGAIGVGLGAATDRGGRACLVLRQTVDKVVHDDVGEVDVLPRGVIEVVAPDGEAVAITAEDEDVLVGAAQGDSGCKGQGPSVNEVYPVRIDEVGEPAGASDTGHADEIGLGQAEFLDDVEERSEDGEVSAGRAPGRMVGLELLLGEFLLRLGGLCIGHRYEVWSGGVRQGSCRPHPRFR